MPIIATTVGHLDKENNFKIVAITVGCTQQEYDEYMEYNQELANLHTIPTVFFTDYVSKHDCSTNDIQNFNIPEQEKNHLIYSWLGLGAMSINNVIKILTGLRLSYDDFVDAYCEYLKTIK